ncbi:MAG: glycosyltransferase family 2 protein [Desulfomonilaceae bacterium]
MLEIPSVSVVIPTYNRLSLLKQTVQSVRSQSFHDFEIIVVDDGSTDDTWDWLASQSDIRAFRQTNQGIAASRNAGIAKALAPWVAFLDHDDLWLPKKLQLQMGFISENPHVALVAARHVRMGSRLRNPWRIQWKSGDLFVQAYAESFIHTSSVIIRKDVLESIGGFDPRYRFADEFDVWLKIARDYPIAYVNKPLVLIRFYEANTSHDRLGLRKETEDILLKHYDPQRIPRRVFRKTMSDHDISYGRAYLKAGDIQSALDCFWRSVTRAPLRVRPWRYYLKRRIASWFVR